MKLKFISFTTLIVFLFSLACTKSESTTGYDVCVYGATSAGVMAAYAAKMKGKSVILLEPMSHLGGLTSGGLGQTDIGNKYAITGLSRDFYQKIGAHYGEMEQWTFEPHVAKGIFQKYLDEAGIEVKYQHQLKSVKKDGTKIKQITLQDKSNGEEVNIDAGVFIDCTYEGDLMAASGVSYTIGRESNDVYGENYNGVQLMDKHQFMDGVDPYIVKGDPKSGLLWGISDEVLEPNGTGDTKLQAYNFRLCLTDSIENQIPISRPEGYDSTKFELLLRYIEKKQAHELNWAHMHIQPMPGRKTDINNSGPFSTDYIGANYKYADASYEERATIFADHKLYTESLLYFLGHDPRVPEHLRKEMLSWGYPKDEFEEFGHFSPQLYVREARRMRSDYIMTEKHCIGEETAEDGVGMAAYTMDSHNAQRVVVNGMVKNEGDVQVGLGGLPPYPISYRSIIPKQTECSNLIVPVCHSASHIAFGSIRMEPVFMVLGQSAGVAAAMAIDGNVHSVDVAALQKELKANPTSDGRAAMITLDNDDGEVEYTGNWESDTQFRGKYGKSLLKSSKVGARVLFKSKDLSSISYDVYAYFPAGEGLTSKAKFVISGKGSSIDKEVFINNKQAGWVFITELSGIENALFKFEVEHVESNKIAIADALVLLPKNI